MVFENQREAWRNAEALCKSNLERAVANDTFGEMRDMLSKNREKYNSHRKTSLDCQRCDPKLYKRGMLWKEPWGSGEETSLSQ